LTFVCFRSREITPRAIQRFYALHKGSDTATFIETMSLLLNLSENGGTQSLTNGSAIGSDRGVSDLIQRHVISHPTLPSIDEVDSLEKIEGPITNFGIKISFEVVKQI